MVNRHKYHDVPAPLGLLIIPEYITVEEEAALLEAIGPPAIRKSNAPIRNRIKRYGSSAPYRNSLIARIIPPYLLDLAEKLAADGHTPIVADSVTINEYLAGQGIGPHVDSMASGPAITILGLACDATMVLTKAERRHQFEFPRRALVQLSAEARHIWNHAVEPVATTRFSLVFRCSTSARRGPINA